VVVCYITVVVIIHEIVPAYLGEDRQDSEHECTGYE
jgi:hypothetical protein